MNRKERPLPWDQLTDGDLTGHKVAALGCAALIVPMPDLLHVSLAQLDAAFLEAHQPSLIIFPLFTATFDATAAIEQLQALGYAGRLAVLAPDLPNPRLVEAELRGMGPGNRLTVITP